MDRLQFRATGLTEVELRRLRKLTNSKVTTAKVAVWTFVAIAAIYALSTSELEENRSGGPATDEAVAVKLERTTDEPTDVDSDQAPAEEDRPGEADTPLLGSGDVQITLRWNAAADLDLHVKDPDGEVISYEHKHSTSGGELDVDANRNCEVIIPNPVENVYWPRDKAPLGDYEVWVHYYAQCEGSGPTEYEITIKVDEKTIVQAKGTITVEVESPRVRFSR